MKTKFGLMLLPLLCAVSVAMAQGVEKEGAAEQPAAVAAPTEAQVLEKARAQEEMAVQAQDKAQAQDRAARPKAPVKAPSRGRMGTHSPKSLPTGDMRHCLDLKTSAEIIRCAETRRNK